MLKVITKDDIPIHNKWLNKPCMVHTTGGFSKGKHLSLAIAQGHVNDNKWDHVGYIFLIERDGTIYFSEPTVLKQYHCAGGGQNHKSFSIAFIGNGNTQYGTMEQMDSLVAIMDKYESKEIRFHCDFSKKTCPGIKLMKTLENHNYTSPLIKRYEN